MLTENLLVSVFSTILGLILSTAASVGMSYRKLLKLPDVRKDWHSEYQAADTPGNPWIYEKITFYTRWGNLRFFTSQNAKDDEIEGEAEICGQDYIIGKWRQRDRRGSNYGTFTFNIAPSGRLIFGVWAGTSESGEKRIGGWVGARQRQDIVKGKLMLSTLTSKLEIKHPVEYKERESDK